MYYDILSLICSLLSLLFLVTGELILLLCGWYKLVVSLYRFRHIFDSYVSFLLYIQDMGWVVFKFTCDL